MLCYEHVLHTCSAPTHSISLDVWIKHDWMQHAVSDACIYVLCMPRRQHVTKSTGMVCSVSLQIIASLPQRCFQKLNVSHMLSTCKCSGTVSKPTLHCTYSSPCCRFWWCVEYILMLVLSALSQSCNDASVACLCFGPQLQYDNWHVIGSASAHPKHKHATRD